LKTEYLFSKEDVPALAFWQNALLETDLALTPVECFEATRWFCSVATRERGWQRKIEKGR